MTMTLATGVKLLVGVLLLNDAAAGLVHQEKCSECNAKTAPNGGCATDLELRDKGWHCQYEAYSVKYTQGRLVKEETKFKEIWTCPCRDRAEQPEIIQVTSPGVPAGATAVSRERAPSNASVTSTGSDRRGSSSSLSGASVVAPGRKSSVTSNSNLSRRGSGSSKKRLSAVAPGRERAPSNTSVTSNSSQSRQGSSSSRSGVPPPPPPRTGRARSQAVAGSTKSRAKRQIKSSNLPKPSDALKSTKSRRSTKSTKPRCLQINIDPADVQQCTLNSKHSNECLITMKCGIRYTITSQDAMQVHGYLTRMMGPQSLHKKSSHNRARTIGNCMVIGTRNDTVVGRRRRLLERLQGF